MAKINLKNPAENFKGISKEKFEKLMSHVSLKNKCEEGEVVDCSFIESIYLDESFKEEVVINILNELNWNYVYDNYEKHIWSDPPSLNHEMGR